MKAGRLYRGSYYYNQDYTCSILLLEDINKDVLGGKWVKILKTDVNKITKEVISSCIEEVKLTYLIEHSRQFEVEFNDFKTFSFANKMLGLE